MGKIDRQQMGPLYCSRRFQDAIQVESSLIVSSNKAESIFLTVTSRRDRHPTPEMGSGKGTKSGNSRFLFRDILCTKKERTVTSSHRPFFAEPTHKEAVIQDGDSQDSKTFDCEQDWAVSINLTDAYLHIPIHPQSRKYLRFVHEDQIFQFMALPFGMSLSPWIFTKLMDVVTSHLRQRAISVFPYLDDWLIRNLIRNRLLYQTAVEGWVNGKDPDFFSSGLMALEHRWSKCITLEGNYIEKEEVDLKRK